MKQSVTNGYLSILAPLLLLFIVLWGGTFSAVMVGGDEGMETAKVFMLAHYKTIVAEMWNDQPWLYSLLFAVVEYLHGPTVQLMRLFSFMAICSFLLTVQWALGSTLKSFERIIMGFLFLLAAQTCSLAFSAMVELPACLISVVVSVLLLKKVDRGTPTVVMALGVGHALCLQMKFTAVVAIVPMIATIFLVNRASFVQRLSQWALGFIGGFVVIALISPRFNLSELIGTHLLANQHSQDQRKLDWLLFPKDIFIDLGLWSACLGGIFVGIQNPQLRRWVIFFTSELIISLIFAAFQRPYWLYYLVQFAIPFSALGAIGLGHGIRKAYAKIKSADETAISELWIINTALSLSLIFGFSLPRTVLDVKRLASLDQIAKDKFIAGVKEAKLSGHQLYTRDVQYSLYFRSPTIPQITVPSLKHYLADAALTNSGLAIVTNAMPDLILVNMGQELTNHAWLGFVTNNYQLLLYDHSKQLWLRENAMPANHSVLVDTRISLLGL